MCKCFHYLHGCLSCDWIKIIDMMPCISGRFTFRNTSQLESFGEISISSSLHCNSYNILFCSINWEEIWAPCKAAPLMPTPHGSIQLNAFGAYR
ncbi:hypothetical protein SAMN03159434_102228 [Enterobacter sp. NFR05]|nr:hypothetical protein SAMN03159434_102228 [Enterobacter sp. NFR05]